MSQFLPSWLQTKTFLLLYFSALSKNLIYLHAWKSGGNFLNLFYVQNVRRENFNVWFYQFQLIDRMICMSNWLMWNQWAFNSSMTMQIKLFEKYSWTLYAALSHASQVRKSMNNHAWKEIKIPWIVCLSQVST